MNSLKDLNAALFEALASINSAKPDELDGAIKRSKAVADIAGGIVANTRLQFDMLKHLDDGGYLKSTTVAGTVLPALGVDPTGAFIEKK